MTQPTQPLIPGMDQVIANLRSIPMVTGRAEQFIGPAGSGQPNIASMPQYEGLEMQSQTVPCTVFEAFDHSQLVANVDPIQSASVDAFRQEWANVANKDVDIFENFATKIGVAMSEKWRGPAGEAASSSIVRYARDSTSMADASNLIARQVGFLSDSLDRTKTDLPPEPAATVPGKVLESFSPWNGWDDERREAAKHQAVQLLNNVYYGSGISPTAQSMPVFPAVRSPVADSPDNTPTDGWSGGPTGGPSGPSSPTTDGGTPGTPNDQGLPGQPGTPTGDSPAGPTSTNAASTPGGPGSDALRGLGGLESPFKPPASTQAAGIPGMGGGVGGGIGSGIGGSGNGSVGGGIGSGSSAGAGSLSAPQPGSAVAGGSSVAGGGGTRTAAGAAGRGMGMAPMGGARGAGGGSDDEEHKTPDYLLNDELSQWVDDQSDRGYAPVIGAQRPPRPTDSAGPK